ncbi:hypothetical protein QU487_17515 [Crenobacter sp. SG2305]|uniref:hypothetical protein n=1 Tax=Crenobacter oryzisoli TaxID=3056844 RepID=UPI0025AAFE3A|nr:hypothetical protein [Crenobacter sp. SG2305]MDN0084537.1 hypothetical protein [Crenobacter sp. SG2305]
MNTTVKLLLSTFLLSTTVFTHAEMTLNTKYFGMSKSYDQLSWDAREPIYNFMKAEEENIKRDLLKTGEITSTSLITWGAHGYAHATFNEKDYYIRAFNYQTAKQDREYTQSTLEKRKHVTLPGGGACVLYVHDKDLNKAASLKISLPENNHGTWCNGVNGLGSARKGSDGVIVSLSYYLTDNTPAKRAQDIGKGWRYMTVLIRFGEQNGKLILTQDDSCLGNPNKIKDIPTARKVLDKCGS